MPSISIKMEIISSSESGQTRAKSLPVNHSPTLGLDSFRCRIRANTR
jgi:hypothetical protein